MALGALQQITGSDMETLIQAVCRSPDLQGVKDIDQHRKGGGSEIESHVAIQNCKNKRKVAHSRPWKGPVSVQSKKETHLSEFLRKI